jgi:ABC-type glycerol-3-phosphate transport system substrate-binding protein
VNATSAPAVSSAAELIYWDWSVTGGPAMEAELKRFSEATGIKVTRVVNAVDKYSDLFAVALRGGDAPDVFYIPQKPTFAEQVANGWLADLTHFKDFADFQARFPDPALNFAPGTNTIDGKTYSAPFGDPKRLTSGWCRRAHSPRSSPRPTSQSISRLTPTST